MKLSASLPNRLALPLFACLLGLLFLPIRTSFNGYDEGFAVTGAMRLLHGEAPYRDFWGIYPPGQIYALAGVFRLFGETLLASRVYDTLGRFLTVVAAYLIARKVSTPWLALLSAAVAGVFLAAAWFYSYAVFPALGLGLWAVFAWLKGKERECCPPGERPASTGARWYFLCGALLGTTLLVRWDLGAYAAFSIAAVEILRLKFSPSAAARALAWVLAPMLAVAGVGYAAVAARSGWGELYAQVFYFPAVRLHDLRWMAYPPLFSPGSPNLKDWLRFYLPILSLVFCASVLALSLLRGPQARRQMGGSPQVAGAAALVLFGALLFNQALSRYDLIHVLPSSVVTFLAACALCAQAPALTRAKWAAAAAAGLVGVLSFLYFVPSSDTLKDYVRDLPPWRCYSSLERASCAWVDENQARAVEYIRSVTGPGEPIFVGNHRHDKLFINDAGFYFLAGRPSATRYHEIHPGVVNTLPVQEEMIAQIEAEGVEWIVLVDAWESTEPNQSAVSTGVTRLDEYLRDNFRAAQSFGSYHILRRAG